MAVYVDAPIHKFGRMVMCHMIADTPTELHSMADRIGVDRKWFQRQASFPHYDIAKSKRSLAVRFGAVELATVRDTGLKMREIRNAGVWKPMEGGWR